MRPQALRAWEHLPRPTGADIITLASGKTSACQASVHSDAASEMALSFPRCGISCVPQAGLHTEPGNGQRTGGGGHDFDEILVQVLDLLQRERRLSYRAIKVRFGLDDDHLEASRTKSSRPNSSRSMRGAESWCGQATPPRPHRQPPHRRQHVYRLPRSRRISPRRSRLPGTPWKASASR